MVSIKTKFLREYTDQVISLINPDGENESVHLVRASSSKHQASSAKLVKQQAASFKPFATSIKLQATSIKLQDPGPFVKFHAPRTEGLYHDKTITWMLHMEGNLVW